MNNQIELTINELQQKQLDMLRHIVEVFDKNEINYSLAYGTLLGAVRHEGPIPWDADIDLFIDYSDIEKIKELFKNDMYGYRYCDIVTQQGHECLNPRIGLNFYDSYYLHVDLYALIHIPNDEEERKRYRAKLRYILKLSYLKCKRVHRFRTLPKKVLALLPKTFLIPISKKNILRLFENTCIKCDSFNGDSVVACAFATPLKYIYKEEWFESRAMMQFGDRKYKVISGYKEFLQYSYGDYMMYPPADVRKAAMEKKYIVQIDR